MLTALDDTDDRISGFESGVTGFLNKPFDRLELLAHIRSRVNLSPAELHPVGLHIDMPRKPP